MRVFVAGHKGLAGSAIARVFQAHGHEALVESRDTLDLRNFDQVRSYVEKNSPDWVVIAAAVVGGIHANSTYPVQFLQDNLKIQNNLIECSHSLGVKKLLFLGSNCMYPKYAEQPLKEDTLLTGAIEPTNEPYAVAKIAGLKLCQAYAKQYGAEFLTVIPTTMYGPNDNYHPENSHVLPALLRRFHEAKLNGDKEVVLWGSGEPTREFMYSDDLAEAVHMLMSSFSVKDIGSHINIGSGHELSILKLAQVVKDVVGLEAEIKLDKTKPDGTPRKVLDSKRIYELGWKPKVEFEQGIARVYEDFLSNENLRK